MSRESRNVFSKRLSGLPDASIMSSVLEKVLETELTRWSRESRNGFVLRILSVGE